MLGFGFAFGGFDIGFFKGELVGFGLFGFDVFGRVPEDLCVVNVEGFSLFSDFNYFEALFIT